MGNKSWEETAFGMRARRKEEGCPSSPASQEGLENMLREAAMKTELIIWQLVLQRLDLGSISVVMRRKWFRWIQKGLRGEEIAFQRSIVVICQQANRTVLTSEKSWSQSCTAGESEPPHWSQAGTFRTLCQSLLLPPHPLCVASLGGRLPTLVFSLGRERSRTRVLPLGLVCVLLQTKHWQEQGVK